MTRVIDLPAELYPDSAPEPPSPRQAQLLLDAMRSSAALCGRMQFHEWLGGYLQAFVPHRFAVCGAYRRARRQVVYDAFDHAPTPPGMLATLRNDATALMQQLIGAWIEGRGRAQLLDLQFVCGHAAATERDQLADVGIDSLLVHGVSRPQRPAELESLFIFGASHWRYANQHLDALELLMPHLHACWTRVQPGTYGAADAVINPAGSFSAHPSITERENEILFWVREGKSNHQIGEQLGISVLTVKNHVQKILRKLGAANRAQAVVLATTRGRGLPEIDAMTADP